VSVKKVNIGLAYCICFIKQFLTKGYKCKLNKLIKFIHNIYTFIIHLMPNMMKKALLMFLAPSH